MTNPFLYHYGLGVRINFFCHLKLILHIKLWQHFVLFINLHCGALYIFIPSTIMPVPEKAMCIVSMCRLFFLFFFLVNCMCRLQPWSFNKWTWLNKWSVTGSWRKSMLLWHFHFYVVTISILKMLLVILMLGVETLQSARLLSTWTPKKGKNHIEKNMII